MRAYTEHRFREMDRRLQPTLPLLEPDGQTHRRDCDCPRCDAGFRPSEQERTQATRRWEAQQARQAAEAALEKKRARNRAKAQAAALRREAAERETAAHLRELAELRRRLENDRRLRALLDSRRQGSSVEEALAIAEGRARRSA
jgi:uncharacterized Zn finger protein (UPF0148 family)